VLNTVYKIFDLSTNVENTYLCEAGHRSHFTNEPGVGPNWRTYWSEWRMAGGRVNGDTLKIEYNPQNYIPDSTIPEAEDDDQSLAAHLAGISNRFGQLSTSSSSEWKGEVANHSLLPTSDNIVGDKRGVISDLDGQWAVYRCVATWIHA
jgi:hypothetical protein